MAPSPYSLEGARAILSGPDDPALTEVLDRIPFDLFESVRALRPWIDGMAGLVDERRQVLVIAGHLLPVLEQATRSPF
jgi:hypothetical protein